MKPIGVIGAMKLEVDNLLGKMTVTEERVVANVTFHVGKFGESGRQVVLAQSGVGKVNAALCAHTMAQTFGVGFIINTGIAGGLSSGLRIGDIIVVTAACHHDFDTTFFGEDKPGEIFFSGVGKVFFDADERLVTLAVEGGKIACPDITVKRGIVASGDQFVHDKAKKRFIIDTFGADCVEMESAAIAQACYLNNTPYVVIRAISDNADEGAFVSFTDFAKQAADNAAAITEYIIKML